MKRIGLAALLTGISIIFFSGIVNASVLDFEIFHSTAVDQSYGDNIGDTPNVTVSYYTSGTGPLTTYTGYGSGYTAIPSSGYDYTAEVTFEAEQGYLVTINSFDMGTWQGGDYNPNLFEIVDGVGTKIWEPASLDIGNGLSTYVPNVTGEAVTIRWRIDGQNTIGIDNINFSQSAVPIPGAVWLLGSGLLGLVSLKKRR